jgi:hypothetical protein
LSSLLVNSQGKNESKLAIKVKTITIENLSNDLLINCESDLKVEKRINGPDKVYSLKIPNNWSFEETFTDGISGIIISKNSNSLNMLGIVEIPNDSLSLDIFFQKEFVRAMMDKAEVEMIDAGTANINGLDSYWIYHKSKLADKFLWTFLYYIQNDKNRNFYLISTSSLKKTNDLNIHCKLRQVVNTFQFVD